MKLRNKKTGEIREVEPITIGGFRSLAELNEEGEDYTETQKEWWYLGHTGLPTKMFEGVIIDPDRYKKELGEIGNHFKSEEEALKVVEKLKAWKRLKDKGFMFCGTDCIKKNNVVYFEFGERPLTQSEADEAEKDLDLLFGGEE